MGHASGIDAAHLPQILARVHAALSVHRTEIDELNVFPVPDGDTGTNMVMTVREVLDALDGLAADAPRDDLCATITRSAMRGARGNSGVILSQVLRALAEAVVEADGPLALAGFGAFLRRARDLAYRAVAEPVEGTILTVIGVASEMAQLSAEEGATDLLEVSAAVRTAVHTAVGRTQEQLDVLRDAGVVDAGARGFEVVVEALHAHLTGASVDELAGAPPPPHVRRADGDLAVREAGSLEYRFEVQYLIDASDDTADGLRRTLEDIGDSVVVVSAGGLASVHVHTNDVGAAIEAGLDVGRPSRIEVTYFADQIADNARAAAGTHEHDEGARPEDPIVATRRGTQPARRLGCVVVLPGPGLRAVARSMDATVVDGAAGALPSVADLLNAIGGIRADRIAILPGHRNIVPTAHQASDVSVAEGGRTLDVVESADTPPGVLAALAVCDPDADPEDVLADMEDAAAAVRTGEVVAAVRDATTPIGEVRQGQLLAVVEGQVVSATDDPLTALRTVAETLYEDEGCEVATLILGADVDDDEGAAAEEVVLAIVGDVELEVLRGDQRPARYLLGVE